MLQGTRASARVVIASDHAPATAETWHLALTAAMPVSEGRGYEVSFMASATVETTFELLLQKAGEPYTTFGYRKVTVGPDPVPVRINGTSPFSTARGDPASRARVFLALGKAAAGTQLTINNISFRKLTLPAPTAQATVDFAQRANVPSLSGFLLGLDVNNLRTGPPDDGMVVPLRPRFWRVRSDWAERVAGWGATPIVLCSEGRYPPASAPWTDNYAAWRKHVTALARKHRASVVYDIWNEPDLGRFFLDWPEADFPKFLETFRVAHDAIREVVPDAVISGPSLSESFPVYRLRQFFEFCKARRLTVQVLSLHMLDRDDDSLEAMKEDIAHIREEFISNPRYAAVGLRDIHVNEYGAVGAPSYRPASILAFLVAMEEAGVVAACRSCWDHPGKPGANSGFDGTLDGILTHDSHHPRAIWWAYKWYAQAEGGRVAATSRHPGLLAVASIGAPGDALPNHAQILLGSTGAGGAAGLLKGVTVQLLNISSLPFVRDSPSRLYARVERISFVPPGTGAVPTPECVTEKLVVPITSGSASLTGLTLAPHDVLRITLGEPMAWQPE